MSEEKKRNPVLRVLAFLVTAALVLGAVFLVANWQKLNFDAVKRYFTYRALAKNESGQAESFSYDGGVNSAAVSTPDQPLAVFRFVKAMAGQQEAAPEEPSQEMADEIPQNCTLEYQALPFTLSLPLTGTVTSPFGARGDPMSGDQSFHHGLDIAAPAGTAIRAVASGTVIEVGFNAAYGNFVVVQHAGDFTSKYAHCKSILVKEGDRVKPSTKLATVGSTGASTGNHLHLELRLSGIFLDPAVQLGVVS